MPASTSISALSRTAEFRKLAEWYRRAARFVGAEERERSLHYAEHFRRLAEKTAEPNEADGPEGATA